MAEYVPIVLIVIDKLTSFRERLRVRFSLFAELVERLGNEVERFADARSSVGEVAAVDHTIRIVDFVRREEGAKRFEAPVNVTDGVGGFG